MLPVCVCMGHGELTFISRDLNDIEERYRKMIYFWSNVIFGRSFSNKTNPGLTKVADHVPLTSVFLVHGNEIISIFKSIIKQPGTRKSFNHLERLNIPNVQACFILVLLAIINHCCQQVIWSENYVFVILQIVLWI